MVTEEEVAAIGRTLLDAAQPLPARFRALFTLRNLGGPAAIDCIVRGFADSSALLKHELAFCLGQMRDRAAIPALLGVLQDSRQEPMVRHEAGMVLQDTTCWCALHREQVATSPGPTGWPGLISPLAVAMAVVFGEEDMAVCPSGQEG